MTNCLITPDEYKQIILDDLSILQNMPCDIDLKASLDFWWSISDGLCDNSLRYLTTYRESLKALMSCFAYQIDIAKSSGSQNAYNKYQSTSEDFGQNQQNSSATNRNDAIANSFYDDFSDGHMRSKATRNGWSWSKDDETRKYDDTGSGGSEYYAKRESKSCSVGQTRRSAAGDGFTTGNGARSGCDFSYSGSSTVGSSAGLSLILVHTSVGMQSSLSNWDRYMSHNETLKQRDQSRSASTNSVLNSAKAESVFNRDSGSSFTANVESRNSGESNSQAHDESHSFRIETFHAEGYGQAQQNSTAEGSSQAQASAHSKGSSSSSRDGWRSGMTQFDMEKNAQRFKHMKALYDQNEMRITEYLRYTTASIVGYTLPLDFFDEEKAKCIKIRQCCGKQKLHLELG